MSDSSTAKVAAQVMSEIGDSTPARDVESNRSTAAVAAHNPQAITAEVRHLMGDGEDTLTRRVAAAMVSKSEPRNFVRTPYGGIRREHIPSGHGSDRTSQIAREVIDAAARGALASPKEQQERELADAYAQLKRELDREQQ